MLSIIAGHQGMLWAMLAVLAAIGLRVVVSLVQSLRGQLDFSELANIATQPILRHVFPLVLLSLLTSIDPTHLLVKIWYFVAAVLVIIAQLLKLASTLKK